MDEQGVSLPMVGVEEIQMADFLWDIEVLIAEVEALYLRAKNMAKGQIPEVEGGSVGYSCTAGGSHGGGDARGWAGKCVCHNVRHT
jgi:hypothetical protein